MALILADRTQQTGTANTTVSFTLSGTVTGFQSFAVVGNTNTTYYSAFDASGNWETGLGTYSTTGPTLTRTTIYQSSNSNAAVTFSGTVNVFVTYPSGRSVNLDASGNASALGTVASGTWQGTVITPTYGGTGTAGTLTGLLYGNGTSAQTVATTAQALTLIGTVPIANGGTNSTATATAGGAGYGTGTAHAYTAAGTSGQPLISAGAAAPAFGTLALGTANTNVSGALTATNGGTGVATLTGIAKGNGTSAFTAATSGTDYSAGTSALGTGILKSTTATGALTIAVAADFPTLNQNTTGSSASCTGNAATATTATTATTANALNTANAYTGTTFSTTSGANAQFGGASATGFYVDGTNVSCRSSTATGFVYMQGSSGTNTYGYFATTGWNGAVVGNATTATTATTANALNTANAYTVAGITSTAGFTATSDAPFHLNATTVSANYTSPANYNLMSAGPITINTGVTVTIDTTGTWVIV